MMALRLGLILAAAAFCWASPALAEQGAAGGQMRVEVRAEDGSTQPRVRMWVNGREVDPGDFIRMGEPGGVRIEPWAGPRDPRPERAEAYLGVMVSARSGGPDAEAGVVVTSVVPDSPAQEAGLAAGDVITAVGDQRVRGPEHFVDLVCGHNPGERVTIAWTRGGKAMDRRVTLGVRPEGALLVPPAAPPKEERRGESRPPQERPREQPAGEAYLGVMAMPLTEEMKEIAGADRGVLIGSLQDGSPAAEAGLLPGDVITAIDGKGVETPVGLTERIRGYKPGVRVRVDYCRSGKKRTVDVKLGERPAGPAERERPRFFEGPQRWSEQFPELQAYLRGLRRWFEEGPRPREGAPAEPRPGAPQPPAAPYGLGRDAGQIRERLERLENRLGDIERRLDRIDKRP
ncbi:MAG: PDZ domain-containing protein [Planctomycetes bacterium]|nr:PDZ domain-containing protein [Planctomycetota bacterium]